MLKLDLKSRWLASVFAALLLVGFGPAGADQGGVAEGIVVSLEGRPLEGLSVSLLEKADAEGVLTDAEGAFRLRVGDGGGVLRISGDLGEGRARFGEGRGEPLRIEYPVRKEIVLLHDNDLHFSISQPDQFKEAVESARERYADVFLLSAGDVFTRHPGRWIDEDSQRRGEDWYAERSLRMIAWMNEMGYDALTPGNHELDYVGVHTRAALDAAEFPLVAANVEIDTEALPETEPFVVLRTSTGRAVAVLGLTVARRKEGVRTLSPHEAAQEHLGLGEEHDIFVALTHLGHRADTRLAERFPQFDAIIGGHSHTLLPNGEMVGPVLVAQAGGNPHVTSRYYPMNLGKVTLTLENGRVVDKRAAVKVFRPRVGEE